MKNIYTDEKRVRVYLNLKITWAAITGESLRCLLFDMQRNRKIYPISFIPGLEIDWFEKKGERNHLLLFWKLHGDIARLPETNRRSTELIYAILADGF